MRQDGGQVVVDAFGLMGYGHKARTLTLACSMKCNPKYMATASLEIEVPADRILQFETFNEVIATIILYFVCLFFKQTSMFLLFWFFAGPHCAGSFCLLFP